MLLCNNNNYFRCFPPEQGFFTMLGSPGPIQANVKEGESLDLRVEFDAYPAPSSWSWSYGGKQLLNTTEHAITVHRHKYRYVGWTVCVCVCVGGAGVACPGRLCYLIFAWSGTSASSDSCESSAPRPEFIGSQPLTRMPPLNAISTCLSTVSFWDVSKNKNIILFHRGWNMTPSLIGKPVIVAQEGPVDGKVRCIAAGYPVPKISWYFCKMPHTR